MESEEEMTKETFPSYIPKVGATIKITFPKNDDVFETTVTARRFDAQRKLIFLKIANPEFFYHRDKYSFWCEFKDGSWGGWNYGELLNNPTPIKLSIVR